jgi:hypothetical protein
MAQPRYFESFVTFYYQHLNITAFTSQEAILKILNVGLLYMFGILHKKILKIRFPPCKVIEMNEF